MRVTFDGGLVLVRALDEWLGRGDLRAGHSGGPRGTDDQVPRADVVRRSGDEDVNDAERSSRDSASA